MLRKRATKKPRTAVSTEKTAVLDTTAFENINVSGVQEWFAGHSAQDDQFNVYNARLTLRGSNPINPGDFRLFVIPPGDKRWQFDIDPVTRKYRSDNIRLVTSVQIELQKRLTEHAVEREKQAVIAREVRQRPFTRLSDKENTQRETITAEQDAGFSKLKTTFVAQIKKYNEEKLRLENARGELEKAYTKQTKQLKVDYFNGFKQLQILLLVSLEEKARHIMRLNLLNELLRTHIGNLLFLEERQIAENSKKTEEQNLRILKKAELETISAGVISSANAQKYMDLIVSEYKIVSEKYKKILPDFISKMRVRNTDKLVSNAKIALLGLRAHFETMDYALTGIITDKDTNMNVMFLLEALGRTRADLRKIIPICVELGSGTDENFFLELNKLNGAPIFQVFHFPFSERVDDAVAGVLMALKGAYYDYVTAEHVCDSVLWDPLKAKMKETITEKKKIVSQCYLFLLDSAIKGTWEMDDTLQAIFTRLDFHIAFPDEIINGKYRELFYPLLRFFKDYNVLIEKHRSDFLAVRHVYKAPEPEPVATTVTCGM